MDERRGITPDRFARLDLDPALRERRTTSDYISDAVRAAIYDGQFADGEELNQVELAAYFKVSRVPIREALRRLQAEGLVSNVAHRRAVVLGLSLPEIIELIEIRAVLEGYLAEKAGPHITRADLQRLSSLCDTMDRLRDYDHDWVVKNWEFHRGLYEHARSPAAVALVEQMHLKCERYVRRAGRGARLREAAAEHRRILHDIERGHYAAANRHVREHILHTGEEIRRHFAQSEDRRQDDAEPPAC